MRIRLIVDGERKENRRKALASAISFFYEVFFSAPTGNRESALTRLVPPKVLQYPSRACYALCN